MKFQVDQSGKIEQTQVNSIIAYSNHTQSTILIPRKLKRTIQAVFRIHGFTELYIYFLFAVGITILLSDLQKKVSIQIDIEYPGKEKIILSMIEKYLVLLEKPVHHISFARIGNKPRVHYAAKDVYDKKKKPDMILTMKDIIQILKKTDGRLRECLSTLVDARSRSIIIVTQDITKFK